MYSDNLTQKVADAAAKIMDEQLKGNQHKIDANKNGKIDAEDFKLLKAKKEVKKEEVEQIDELSKKTLGNYIKRNADDQARIGYINAAAQHDKTTDRETKNKILDKNENNDNSSGIEDFNKGINEMNAAFDEMSNIFNKDKYQYNDANENKSENVNDSSKKESFKEGNKCKRNTEIAKYIKIIKTVIDAINDILFVKFDTYLTRGISAVYDQIEGSNKSGFIDMKNSENMENNEAGENMENNEAGENMENNEAGENIENKENDENIENKENGENIENKENGENIEKKENIVTGKQIGRAHV